MTVPDRPKLYHIVHVDRLASILADGHLWSDAEVRRRNPPGTTIGMRGIKDRRLMALQLNSRPGLYVGHCVPFYFCPRSLMLYLLHRGNHPEIAYAGGQEPIVHLVFDLHQVVDWAESRNLRWAFTLTNAGSSYFEDRCDLAQLDEINWQAVRARDWRDCKDEKQAEFLVERHVAWELVESIGVCTQQTAVAARQAIRGHPHRPRVSIERRWYY